MPATVSSTFVAADGDAYERHMGRWSRRLAPLLLDFAGSADGEAVLDLGCGPGQLTDALAQRQHGGRIVGADLSADYIDHARRHRSDARISFAVEDACALSMPDASFDRVLSLLMLHFVPEPLRAIREMRRVAKPGATVAAAVWDVRGGFVANRLLLDTAAAIDPRAGAIRARNYTRPMTRPGELAAAWAAAGLADVQSSSLAIRMEFADFDDYWSPYEGQEGPVAQYVRTLDQAGRATLREAVRAAYLDGDEDGPRSYAALAWAVKGRA